MSILNKVFKNKDEKEQKNDLTQKDDGTVAKNKDEEKIKGRKLSFGYLVKPLVTEKGTELNKGNKYIFEVTRKANKIEVKKAIKEIYGIMPADVNIVNLKGKKVGMMRKIKGKRRDIKKAIITLKKGEHINIFEK